MIVFPSSWLLVLQPSIEGHVYKQKEDKGIIRWCEQEDGV